MNTKYEILYAVNISFFGKINLSYLSSWCRFLQYCFWSGDTTGSPDKKIRILGSKCPDISQNIDSKVSFSNGLITLFAVLLR